MASEQSSRVVLLPIQPHYVRAIIDGKKKVEFRRRKFGSRVDYIVVYSTYPVQRIVAFFRVSHITEGSPSELWMKYKHAGGIDEEGFRTYYRSAKQAVAIGIDEVAVLNEPLPLEVLCGSLSPPQSFVYLSRALFERIRKHV